MLTTQQELKDLILQNTPLNFTRRYLFDQNVYIFEKRAPDESKGNYHDFKCAVAEKLDTSPNNVAIVGSGKFGFSMNPTKKKLLAELNSNSDLDIVIACPDLFEETWNQLRKAYYSNQQVVYEAHGKQIFQKFLTISDNIKYNTSHIRKTIILLTEMKKDIKDKFRIKRVINYRIYSKWSDVEDYHNFGINILKDHLSGPRGSTI
ncbi:hypothetical protein PsAD5_02537 [Pseudovibrio sp. Ad5]|uniref:hypothetical protein n=1 Tax=Pseudovibrio sp. Ad5 TaxID=989436 RepID=UPI0007AEA052|nr:hypothetical protein [Pseudovibrio sp. Ad5]KZK96350.1 hypothetical protein PsAD5_02537 [Pseudovibrio sp. Ad5]